MVGWPFASPRTSHRYGLTKPYIRPTLYPANTSQDIHIGLFAEYLPRKCFVNLVPLQYNFSVYSYSMETVSRTPFLLPIDAGYRFHSYPHTHLYLTTTHSYTHRLLFSPPYIVGFTVRVYPLLSPVSTFVTFLHSGENKIKMKLPYINTFLSLQKRERVVVVVKWWRCSSGILVALLVVMTVVVCERTTSNRWWW